MQDVPLIVVCLVSPLISSLVTLLIVRRYIRQQEDRIRATIVTWVTAPDENIPSPLAAATDQIATVFAARIAKHVLASIHALTGQVANGAKGEIAAAAEAEVAASHPALGILANFLPKKIKRQMLTNPQFMQGLSQIVGNKGNGHAAGVQSSLFDRLKKL